MEDYLEDLADRHRRLVLLIDEFEVLASYDNRFWEWFEKLVTGYDVSMVVTARMDLGEFRSAREGAPSFFNMFRSVYAGSFCRETVEVFLREKSEITDFDYLAVRDVIDELAGRFPYYIQVAAALFYLHAGGASKVTPETLETIRTEFRARTEALFDDAWHKLPHIEREALAWLLLDTKPQGADEQLFSQALQSLERRAYVVEGRVFSSAFAAFVGEQIRRVALNPATARVRVGTEVYELDSRSAALLAHLMANEGLLINSGQIAEAVWPEHAPGADAVTDEMVEQVVERLRETIEEAGAEFQHIELVPGSGYRFLNCPA
jgi:DNA-binding response OmpR family regulator